MEKEIDRLAVNAKAAMDAGMSYGKWMALQYGAKRQQAKEIVPKSVSDTRACAWCGKEFRMENRPANKKYCCDRCKKKADNQRCRKAYQERKKKEREHGENVRLLQADGAK